MGSIVLDGAEIGEGSFIGAGSLVPQGKIIPPNTLAFGRPAKVVRELNDDDKRIWNGLYENMLRKGSITKH